MKNTRKNLLIKISLIFYLFVYFTSCNIHSEKYWNHKRDVIYRYQEKIPFENLESKMKVKVLYFKGLSYFSVNTYSNVVIGLNEKNDTILFLDKYFTGECQINEDILVLPDVWDDYDKSEISTQLGIKNLDIKLISSVHRGYYCKIDTNSVEIKSSPKRYMKVKSKRLMYNLHRFFN